MRPHIRLWRVPAVPDRDMNDLGGPLLTLVGGPPINRLKHANPRDLVLSFGTNTFGYSVFPLLEEVTASFNDPPRPARFHCQRISGDCAAARASALLTSVPRRLARYEFSRSSASNPSTVASSTPLLRKRSISTAPLSKNSTSHRSSPEAVTYTVMAAGVASATV